MILYLGLWFIFGWNIAVKYEILYPFVEIFFFSIYSLVSFLEKLYNLWTSLFELLLSTSWLMELLRRGLLSFLASFCLNIVMTDLDYLFWNKFVDFYSYFCVHLDRNYAEPDYLRFRPQRSVRRRWLWMWLSGVMLALHSWGLGSLPTITKHEYNKIPLIYCWFLRNCLYPCH